MRTLSVAIRVAAAGALIGCGSQAVVDSSVSQSGSHDGGILVPIGENEAYVELLNGDRRKAGKAFETTIVAYLIQADKKTPYSETPTSLEVKIGTAKGAQVVSLKPAPDSADPLGSARFVSTPGPFELTDNAGEVKVQVGGKTLSGRFRGPR
jgi:hypothetical protein